MTTYLLERKTNIGHDVLWYYHQLKDAKDGLLTENNQKGLSILMMQGSYFGEGFHQYRLIKVVNMMEGKTKWRRIKDNLDEY